MSALDIVFVITLITAPFLFMRWLRPKFIFGIAVLVGLAVAASSTSISQFQVQQLLKKQSSGATVSINGQPAKNAEEVINTLKGLRDVPAHHSSPTRRISVDARGTHPITLELGRDSSNPREYWVFYPKHLVTRDNEIGRITTPLFDAY